MNEGEFPALVPVLPNLPAGRLWRYRALVSVGPQRHLFQLIGRALAVYKDGRREYAACTRRYLRRRQELEQRERRQAQPEGPQRRIRGSPAAGRASAEDLGGPDSELTQLLAEILTCHRRVWQAFDAVTAACDELELLDAGSGGGESKALGELQTSLATARPGRRLRDSPTESSHSEGNTAVQPRRPADRRGAAIPASDDSDRTRAPVNKPSRDGYKR